MNTIWRSVVFGATDSGDEIDAKPEYRPVVIESIDEIYPEPKIESVEDRNERMWKALKAAAAG